jgi:hypothetical protein
MPEDWPFEVTTSRTCFHSRSTLPGLTYWASPGAKAGELPVSRDRDAFGCGAD